MFNRFRPFPKRSRLARYHRTVISDTQTTTEQVFEALDRTPGFYDELAEVVLSSVLSSDPFEQFADSYAMQYKLSRLESERFRKSLAQQVASIIYDYGLK